MVDPSNGTGLFTVNTLKTTCLDIVPFHSITDSFHLAIRLKTLSSRDVVIAPPGSFPCTSGVGLL